MFVSLPSRVTSRIPNHERVSCRGSAFRGLAWHPPGLYQYPDECGLGNSGCNGSPFHGHVGKTAVANMDPETRVQDSCEGTGPCRGLWVVDARHAVSPVPALDPDGGRQGATLLRHAFCVVPM